VLGLAAVLFIGRLGARALWSEEVRWAEIPREMQLNADYLHPTINGHTYYDKPLGSYWLVLVASWLRGGVDETAARLPCALCGLLAVTLVMLIARRLFDEHTAILSGVILASCFSFVFFSRHASADMETVTGMLAALWLFLRYEQRGSGWWTVGLWLVMALTSLTKGLLGFALPLLVIGLYSTLSSGAATSRQASHRTWLNLLVTRNRWLFNRHSLLAILLGLAVYLLPFLLSCVVTGSTEGLGMVYRENIRRFYAPVNHRGPIFLYAGVIFLLLAPWSLLLPAALAHAHHRNADGTRSPGERFLLVWFWGIFLFFTCASSRRSYYLLPVLPAGAILIARLLVLRHEQLPRLARGLLIAGYVVLVVAAVGSIVLLLPAANVFPDPWSQLPGLPHPWVFVMLWGVCVGSVFMAFRSFRRGRVAISCSLIAIAFLGYLFLIAAPGMERYRTQKQFVEEVRARLEGHLDQLALLHHRDSVYYLGQPFPIAECQSTPGVERANAERKVRWVLLRRRDAEAFGTAARVVCTERISPWDSAQRRSQKLLLLDLFPRRED
jgi:4-amino-4-deoxy-L-arabinose transferase-like glycosyltransferase